MKTIVNNECVGDFFLLEGISNEDKPIFRYASKTYGDLFCWRETLQEANSEVVAFKFRNMKRAKGFNNVMKIIKFYKQEDVR